MAREPPYKIDTSDVLRWARRKVLARIGNALTLKLPGVDIPVHVHDRERQVARELTVRLTDRRVLSSKECCDGCIADALRSLQEVRNLLVEKQVALADVADGPLYLVLDFALVGIRQFLTYEERLHLPAHGSSDVRQAYFDGLELLRAHLRRCAVEIARIAGPPHDSRVATQYPEEWSRPAYEENP